MTHLERWVDKTVLLHPKFWTLQTCCTVHSYPSFNLMVGYWSGTKCSRTTWLTHLHWWSERTRALAYGQLPRKFVPNYNDITSQIWHVGGVLCDLIIAVCMSYYVGFSHFSLLSLGLSDLFPYPPGSFRNKTMSPKRRKQLLIKLSA